MCVRGVGIAAQGGIRPQRIAAGYGRAALGVALDAADKAVLVVIGVLQPIYGGVGGVHRAPERLIGAVFSGDSGGQRIGIAVSRTVRHIVPANKFVAVAGRRGHDERRAVSGIDRLRTVAAVHVEFQHIVVAVVVALKDGRAVRGHCFGVVIQLGKALGLLAVSQL